MRGSNFPVIGFAGMTHLGLVSATAISDKGFKTVCFDSDAALIAHLQQGHLPVVEPGLDDLYASNRDRQVFTARVEDLTSCSVVYIAPDVPTDDKGGSNLSGILALINQVIAHLSEDAILVVLCQVPPGFTRRIALSPERLFYQVETLIFGRAVERATMPERFILGCADPASALPSAYANLLQRFGCPILPMRYESAELAKISINMCLVASISVANTLAELCEATGAVWSEIVPALKLDRRIGQYAYLAPGLGIAGGNLERDLATVLRFSEEYGTEAGIVRAWLANSAYRRDWALRTLHKAVLSVHSDPCVAVWGLAYKENTHSIKNSPSLATISHLPPCRLQVYDPVVPGDVVGHAGLSVANSALAAAQGSDVLMIMTPWPLFKDVDPALIAKMMIGKTVIDPFAVLDSQQTVAAGFDHYVLGSPPERTKKR